MRRRLWWALILFDTRMAELASSSTTTLDNTWDCKIPLNVSDTDLRPEMKVPPTTRGEPTDAVFVVIRSELGDYIRHSKIHLDFANIALKSISKHAQNSSAPEIVSFVKLEEMIENRYLKFCDPENPIHFLATWMARAHLAKYHLMEHNLKFSSSSTSHVEAQYDAATGSALRVLESDTKIMTSPLTKGFVWLAQIYFPFPAYYQIAQDLKRRPTCDQAHRAWDIMSDDWEAWFNVHFDKDSPIFQIFSKIVLQAWEAYEGASKPPGETLTTPRIVSSIRETLARRAEIVQSTDLEGGNISTDMGTNDFHLSMPLPPAFVGYNLPYGTGMQSQYAWMTPGMSSASDSSGQGPLDTQMNQMDWTAIAGWYGGRSY